MNMERLLRRPSAMLQWGRDLSVAECSPYYGLTWHGH